MTLPERHTDQSIGGAEHDLVSAASARRGSIRRSLVLPKAAVLLAVVLLTPTNMDRANAAGEPNSTSPQLIAVKALASGAAQTLRDAIAIRVQQTIASLPPSAPQPVEYRFDSANQTWTRGNDLPATVFTTPETIAQGALSLSASISYFELRSLDRKASYQLSSFQRCSTNPCEPLETLGFLKFGVNAQARAGILTLAGSYGLSHDIELDLTVPITLVSATAGLQYSAATPYDDSGRFLDLSTFPSVSRLDRELMPGGSARLNRRPLSDVGIDGFDGSTEVGLGRVGVATKAALPRFGPVRLAFSLGVFLPSPSEDELAGTDTTSVFPRLLASLPLTEGAHLYTDLGYEYDFEEATLRRFAWIVGGSYATPALSFDLGVSGSLYDQGQSLFPRHTVISTVTGISSIIDRLDDSSLATNFVDLVLGVRLPIADKAFIAGAVTIPVVNIDFRPEAIGTISTQIEF